MSLLDYVLSPDADRADRFMALPTEEGYEVWDSEASDTAPIVFDTPEAAAGCAACWNALITLMEEDA